MAARSGASRFGAQRGFRHRSGAPLPALNGRPRVGRPSTARQYGRPARRGRNDFELILNRRSERVGSDRLFFSLYPEQLEQCLSAS
jgi:hypothetical protein